MHQPGEPHVEVILDRIKQVIARDSRGSDPDRSFRTAVPATDNSGWSAAYDRAEPADADEAAEVLELAEDGIVAPAVPLLADNGDGADHRSDPAGEQSDEDLAAHGWAEPEGLGAAQAYEQPVARASDAGLEPPLTRAETRTAMRDNLAALAALSALSRERQARGHEDVSVEALTRDLLRPMLAEWLDANLPPIVERLVQSEIRRIVGEQV